MSTPVGVWIRLVSASRVKAARLVAGPVRPSPRAGARSIDVFGAGFTSLAYLNQLAVGELKLDRPFLADLGQKRDFKLVRATIDLGHALGLRVVAEGIEDRSTLDQLGNMGCARVQGYFIGKAKPADELSLGQVTEALRGRAARRNDELEAERGARLTPPARVARRRRPTSIIPGAAHSAPLSPRPRW